MKANQLSRYLWIDSLCIIQDNKADWAVECSRMAGVYANSHFTIAAACSKDSSEGFIKAPSPFVGPQCVFTPIAGVPGQSVHVRAFDWPEPSSLSKRA
jgi:hypothetical protein